MGIDRSPANQRSNALHSPVGRRPDGLWNRCRQSPSAGRAKWRTASTSRINAPEMNLALQRQHSLLLLLSSSSVPPSFSPLSPHPVLPLTAGRYMSGNSVSRRMAPPHTESMAGLKNEGVLSSAGLQKEGVLLYRRLGCKRRVSPVLGGQ